MRLLEKFSHILLTLRAALGGKVVYISPFEILFSITQEPLVLTCSILVKLCLSGQNLVMNILKLKCSPHVASEFAQTLHFLGPSEFTELEVILT